MIVWLISMHCCLSRKTAQLPNMCWWQMHVLWHRHAFQTSKSLSRSALTHCLPRTEVPVMMDTFSDAPRSTTTESLPKSSSTIQAGCN